MTGVLDDVKLGLRQLTTQREAWRRSSGAVQWVLEWAGGGA